MDWTALSAELDFVSERYARLHGFQRTPEWLALKVAEEAGEVVKAFLAATGQGRSRGKTSAELCDALDEEIIDVLCHALLLARHRGTNVQTVIDRKWLRRDDIHANTTLAADANQTTKSLDPTQPCQELRIGWFGTSLMEHYEAHSPRLSAQADLPAIGDSVEVTQWRHRGYVHALLTQWQVCFPWITLTSENHSEGGATSRDILATIRAVTQDTQQDWDLAVLGAGINDVWRIHQRRLSEAVEIEEFDTNLRAALQILTASARQVLVVGEPPMGWEPNIAVLSANADIAAYNQRARRAADDHGAHYVDVWDQVVFTATCLGWSPTAPTQPPAGATSLWSDGVHLSEHGDELVRALIDRHVSEHRILDRLLSAARRPTPSVNTRHGLKSPTSAD